MIFDVSGLWTAILRSHDTDGFYKELMQAQLSIEQHTKLVLEELDIYSEDVMDYLYEASYRKHSNTNIDDIIFDKQDKEARKLESYYREYFWRRMLRYNRLHIYLPQFDVKPDNTSQPQPTDPRLLLVKWDVDAMAELSHYLSKRKVIGEYYILPLGAIENKERPEDLSHNFVCIGGKAKPFTKDGIRVSLPRQIADTYSLTGNPHELTETDTSNRKCGVQTTGSYHHREFAEIGKEHGDQNYFTYVPTIDCYNCAARKAESNTAKESWKQIHLHCDEDEPRFVNCPYENDEKAYKHLQLAQMFLWRERPDSPDEHIKFQVSLTGASGPATKALSAILVDREQKISMFGKEWDQSRDHNKLFLNELQHRIRTTFTDQYFDTLRTELKSQMDLSTDIEHCLVLLRFYLSTVLYRYFLPFLTWDDEYRIYNGMQVFLITLRHYKNGSNNKPVTSDFEKTVLECMKELLKRFKGVEAMYAVTVDVPSPDLDRRQALDIQLASDVMATNAHEANTSAPRINDVTCFFGERKNDS